MTSDVAIKFWKEWIEAGELERFDLVEKLLKPSVKLKRIPKYWAHSLANLLNSWFEDLYEIIKKEEQ